jgi:hypothetical protein
MAGERTGRGFDFPAVLALVWALSSAGVTVALGSQLGARGWMWLGANHILCAIGTQSELRRHYRQLKDSSARE